MAVQHSQKILPLIIITSHNLDEKDPAYFPVVREAALSMVNYVEVRQGGHGLWKTGKMMKKNSLNGKIREFDKNKKIREKSGNFTIAVKKS